MNIESFNSDQHLSYEELVEYNQGNLSNSEMHRLEQHLISCELCNDALEGIGLLKGDNATATIDKIIESAGAAEPKGLGLYQYMAIAASIILIAVLGFVFTRSADEPQLLADEVIETPDKSSIEKTSEEDQVLAESSDEIDNTTEDTLQLAMAETSPEPISEQAGQAVFIEESAEPTVINDVENEEVIAPREEPIIMADLEIANDSAISGAEDTTYMAIAEVESQETDDFARAKKSAPAEAISSEELSEIVTLDNSEYIVAEPEKGMRAYQRYLKRNLVFPESAKDNNVAGDVVLRVTINNDGSVGEIQVISSLGYGCDQEAIRLVRDGGVWNPATRGGSPINDQVDLTVTFK